MDFNIYSDESGLEALIDKTAHKYVGIGSIWMPADYRATFKEEFKRILANHNKYGELKWQKVSPSYFDLYLDVLEMFFNLDLLRFRIIVIESKSVDHITYNKNDAELGFYKFYYQLFHHWIYDFNNYSFFLDHKENREVDRLSVLRESLMLSNLSSKILNVQALPSNESLGIQLADILTGLVLAKYNNQITSKAKTKMISACESHLGRIIGPTGKWEEKFNVFKIDLRGGW
ncbi:DUF3800 domain-containing protein [Antarcticibacterium sp. 1MA-6-2]|uniref:DUF3800 domain-containing protein n=1 Tax=Antarcticibacterium sp. 1MA-6-2 TaxID=2908210 RepID=UPI001F2ADCB5|nr:DUF3800 domain-containing protein [Antarcticibacterium sp. 1MA-6-2]UJH90559.1 DUF3800 domain-containing protein [Antarcticibacterium sp. 1MA-6-2]